MFQRDFQPRLPLQGILKISFVPNDYRGEHGAACKLSGIFKISFAPNVGRLLKMQSF
jgi:hypothetical protein